MTRRWICSLIAMVAMVMFVVMALPVQALELISGGENKGSHKISFTQVGSDPGLIKVVWTYPELMEGNTTLSISAGGFEHVRVNDEAKQGDSPLLSEPAHEVTFSHTTAIQIVSRDVPNTRGTRTVNLTLRFAESTEFEYRAVSEGSNVESLSGKYKLELKPGDLDSKPDGGGGSGGDSGGSGGGTDPDDGSGGGSNEGGGNPDEKPDTGGGGDIDWGEGDRTGVEMEWEHEAQSVSDKGLQKIWFYYPMTPGATVNMKLVANGAEVLNFLDRTGAADSVEADPNNPTYSVSSSSGVLSILDKKWYQKDKRRVIELTVRFSKGCLVRGEATSTATVGWPIATCSFNVSLTPGDEGDMSNGDLQFSVEQVNSSSRRITTNYYGPIENYKYIVWRIWIDSNNDGKFSDSELVPIKNVTFNSTYTQAVFMLYKQGNLWPGYKASVRLTSEWEDGGIDNPQYDPSKPSPDDPIDGGGGGIVLSVTPVVPPEFPVVSLMGYGAKHAMYVGDTIPIAYEVTSTSDYAVSYRLIKYSNRSSGQVTADDTYLTKPSIHASLSNSGGSIEINEEGPYSLVAYFVTPEGYAVEVTTGIVAFVPPTAQLITKGGDIWNYALNQEIDISSFRSYEHGDYEFYWHKIDHTRDKLEIAPMDGQKVDSIYVMNKEYNARVQGTRTATGMILKDFQMAGHSSPIGAYRAIGFAEPGRYRLTLTVENEAGKTGTITEVVNIDSQADPTLQATVPAVFYRDVNDANKAKIAVSGPYSDIVGEGAISATSPDGSTFKDLEVSIVYDANNDGVWGNSIDKSYKFTGSGTADDGFGVTVKTLHNGNGARYFDLDFKTGWLGRYRIELSCMRNKAGAILPIIPVTEKATNSVVLYTEVANTAPSAKYHMNPWAKVDVVFALGKVSNDKEFKSQASSVKAMLEGAGNYIDAKVSEIKTVDVSFGGVNDWGFQVAEQWHAGSGYINSHKEEAGCAPGSVEAYGSNIRFSGYGSTPFYDYGLYQKPLMEKLIISFTVTAEKFDTHTLDNAGFNFGFPIGEPRSGYSVYMDRTSFALKDNRTGHIYWSEPRQEGRAYTVKIVCDPKNQHIDVEVDGRLVKSIDAPIYGPQFGPYCHYANHGCSSQSIVAFTNIVMQYDTTKTLGEALGDVSWRDNAFRFLININDTVPKEFQNFDSTDFRQSLAKVLSSNAYVANIGTSASASKLQQFGDMITTPAGDPRAKYFNKGGTSQTLRNVADWIVDTVKKNNVPSDWVLVGTRVGWDTEYSDDNKDIQLAKTSGFSKDNLIQASKWRFKHYERFYDNSQVKEPYSGVWITDPVTVFNRPGQFRINYKEKDNPLAPDRDLSAYLNQYRLWSADYDVISGAQLNSALQSMSAASGYSAGISDSVNYAVRKANYDAISSEGSSNEGASDEVADEVADTSDLENSVDQVIENTEVQKAKSRSIWARIRSLLIQDVSAAAKELKVTDVTYDWEKYEVTIKHEKASQDYNLHKDTGKLWYDKPIYDSLPKVGEVKAGTTSTVLSGKDLFDDQTASKPTASNFKISGNNGKLNIFKSVDIGFGGSFTLRTVDASDGSKSLADIRVSLPPNPVGYKIYAGTKVLETTTSGNGIDVNISVDDIRWPSNLYIATWTASGDISDKVKLSFKIKDIFSAEAKDDNLTVDEGKVSYLEVMKNDVFDKRYKVPELIFAEIVSGEGTVQCMPLESISGVDGLESKYYIRYEPPANWNGTVVVKYKYAEIRSDLPALEATATVQVVPVNDPPIAKTVNRVETAGITSDADGKYRIPVSILLAQVEDPDTAPDKLKISGVERPSSGTVSLSGSEVVVSPAPGFYGLLSFYYKANDGELDSFWALAYIDIGRTILHPIAADDDFSVKISANGASLGVITNDQSSGNTDLIITGYTPLMLNGVTTNAARLVTQFDGAKPFCRLEFLDVDQFAGGDVLTFNYSLATASNPSQTTTATVRIFLEAPDPTEDNEGYLHVHRKPTARYQPTLTKSGTVVTAVRIEESKETSRDLDHSQTHATWNESRGYSWKGIRAWEWAIRKDTQSWDTMVFDSNSYMGSAKDARTAGLQWINSRLSSYGSGGSFSGHAVYVSLRVRDIDGPDNIGVWSDPFVLMVTDGDMPPIAFFELSNSTFWFDPSNPDKFWKEFGIEDLSYSPVGNTLTEWTWEYTPNGKRAAEKVVDTNRSDPTQNIKERIYNSVRGIFTSSYRETDPEFRIKLTVKDDHSKKSEAYIVTFWVYLQNQPPDITVPSNSQSNTIEGSTLYEIDDGADGVVADNYGTMGNSTQKGTIDFANLLKVTDDQLDTVKMNWDFSGQFVKKRSLYRDGVSPSIQKTWGNKRPGDILFTNTVTEQGFAPGAYMLTVVATDNPNSDVYGENQNMTTVWTTKPAEKPYHFYVVPKIYADPHYFFKGYRDGLIHVESGKAYTEMGLTDEDIAPCVGETVELYLNTNQYVTAIKGFYDFNRNGVKDGPFELEFDLENRGVNGDGTIKWAYDFMFDEVPDPENDADVLSRCPFVFEASTTWGSETDEIMRTKTQKLDVMVLPVKLYDFNVQYVSDPDITEYLPPYIAADGHRAELGGVPAGDLGLDNSVLKTGMRKGYSFYFEIWSKGLQNDNDFIRIKPRFFEVKQDVNGVTSIGNELTAYLQNKDRSWTSMQDTSNEYFNKSFALYYEGERIHLLGSHARVDLPIALRTKKGSEQVWKGRYGIPGSTRFAPTGTVLSDSTEYKGDVLVTFEFIAMKKGQERYNYIAKKQWMKERTEYPNGTKGIYSAKEDQWRSAGLNLGSTVVYDVLKSVEDEYGASPVWDD